jgi:transposase
MKQIRDILRLFEKDLSRRMIATALNISRPVVSEYIKHFQEKGIKYCQIAEISDTELNEKLGFSVTAKSDKYKLLEANFPAYRKELGRTGVTLQLLWQEYREEQSDGYSRSQFSHYYREWKKENKLSMHMEHKAGDKMFVDFTGQKMQITDRQTGEIQDAEIFVSILGASQKTFTCAVASQKKVDWIWANVKSLEYFGGVLAGIVPDCLKSAVIKGCKYEPTINQDYDDFAEHYGLVILPARPYHPKDKALAENAVRLIYPGCMASSKRSLRPAKNFCPSEKRSVLQPGRIESGYFAFA